MTTLGDNIRGVRKAKGMSQKRLERAADFKVSTSQISLYETGRVTPSIEVLHRIADALGVSIREFFS